MAFGEDGDYAGTDLVGWSTRVETPDGLAVTIEVQVSRLGQALGRAAWTVQATRPRRLTAALWRRQVSSESEARDLVALLRRAVAHGWDPDQRADPPGV